MRPFSFGALPLLVLLATACNHSSPAPAPDRQVEYQVLATGTSTASLVAYADQAGGLTQLTNVSLPAHYAFKRTLPPGSGLNIVATVAAPPGPVSITATILVDGVTVQSQTGTSPGGGTAGPSATANIAYVLP